MKKALVTFVLAATTLPLLALAQGTHGGPGGHGGHGGHGQAAHHQQQATNDTSPSTQAYGAANERMHQEMMIQFTGDADVDFIHGMIPHHRGAVEMAAIVLQYGQDPEVRALAEQIIAEQEREIVLMQEILKRLSK